MLLTFAVLSVVGVRGTDSAWYDGISGITVLSPRTASAQSVVNTIWNDMEQDAHGNASAFQKGQFGYRRRAILLRSGDYGNLTIPVNWYTSVMGVGLSPDDVLVQGFSSVDAYPGSAKGSLENFWKSVEGLTTKESSTLWAVSQAAPLRRSVIGGDLWLSETDEKDGTTSAHYTSGGFLADVTVRGAVSWGTQQQFFFRSSNLSNVNYTSSGRSMVFVGVNGAPDYDASRHFPLISNVPKAPRVAEKPYLCEVQGEWYIAVPVTEIQKRGSGNAITTMIPMSDVFVAKEGDTADAIQSGLKGKRALLLTPAIYGLDEPIYVSTPHFVVLGIGMPTLVATKGLSALVVSPNAEDVRVAQVLLEAGTKLQVDSTEPLLFWRGSNGVASDLFARVGAFSYETEFHESCLVTQANVMVRADGDSMVFDNAWLWHADHDDCTESLGTNNPGPPKSDEAFSATGLQVNGDNVIGYGVAVEHTKADHVQWQGDNGQLFFFQSELPYKSNLDFGKEGSVGFRVGYSVQNFTGYGIGVYQVFNTYSMDTSFRFPASVNMFNMFTWCITGNRSGLGNLVCTRPGSGHCEEGDCDGNSCQLLEWPRARPPEPRSDDHVGEPWIVA